jgi:hypothetical protein
VKLSHDDSELTLSAMHIPSSIRFMLSGAALACGIFFLVSAAVPPPKEAVMVNGLEFAHWEQGQPPVKLIRSSEGFCALTMVRGAFEGGGEHVRLWVEADGFWYLGGRSFQADVSAECVIVRYRELAGVVR